MTALKGATALVTGGAGTIGSTIVDQLLAADVSRVRILDNLVRGRRANLAQCNSGRHAIFMRRENRSVRNFARTGHRTLDELERLSRPG